MEVKQKDWYSHIIDKGVFDRMKRKFLLIGFITLFMLVLAACGGEKESEQDPSLDKDESRETAQTKQELTEENGTRTIEYLGESYTVPEKVERIVVTGAMEAMEDMVVLDVHPVGAIAVGGKFPELYASVTDKAESIGEKIKPNFEKNSRISSRCYFRLNKVSRGSTWKVGENCTYYFSFTYLYRLGK